MSQAGAGAWFARLFELSKSSGTARLVAMEGLRGIAVLLVFCVHYVSTVEPWLPRTGVLHDAARRLHHVGNFGVDLFFVLSGYLIYAAVVRMKHGMGRFLIRRVERIYPVFVVILVIYVALSLAMGDYHTIPRAPGDAALFILSNLVLLPGLFPEKPIISVSWSLSWEFCFYIALPLLYWLLAIRRWPVGARLALWVALAIIFNHHFAWAGAYARAAMFFAGIILFEAIDAMALSAGRRQVGIPAFLAVLVFGWNAHGDRSMLAWEVPAMFVGFLLLCFDCFSRPRSLAGRAASWTPLRWLGNMSYSFYLTHGLTLSIAGRLAAALVPANVNLPFAALFLVVSFMAAIVASAVMFWMIERPMSLSPARGRRPATATPTV